MLRRFLNNEEVAVLMGGRLINGREAYKWEKGL